MGMANVHYTNSKGFVYDKIPSQTLASNSFGSTISLNDESLLISRGELEELRADSALLWALIEEGVEDWDGYDRAVLKT